jgi:hypothetical protein
LSRWLKPSLAQTKKTSKHFPSRTLMVGIPLYLDIASTFLVSHVVSFNRCDATVHIGQVPHWHSSRWFVHTSAPVLFIPSAFMYCAPLFVSPRAHTCRFRHHHHGLSCRASRRGHGVEDHQGHGGDCLCRGLSPRPRAVAHRHPARHHPASIAAHHQSVSSPISPPACVSKSQLQEHLSHPTQPFLASTTYTHPRLVQCHVPSRQTQRPGQASHLARHLHPALQRQRPDCLRCGGAVHARGVSHHRCLELVQQFESIWESADAGLGVYPIFLLSFVTSSVLESSKKYVS